MNAKRRTLADVVGPVALEHPQIPERPPRPRDLQEPPAEPPAAATPDPAEASARRSRPPASKKAVPTENADLDDGMLGRWRWQLGATARKAAAAQVRADAALADWQRLVIDARAAGVPDRLVVAAAADAGVEIPGGD